MNYNSANYNYNPDFVDGRRYNGDEHAINNASSSVDYNVPEYPINHAHDIYQMRLDLKIILLMFNWNHFVFNCVVFISTKYQLK